MMKLILLLVLFSFSARAQDAGAGLQPVISTLNSIAPSVIQTITNAYQVRDPFPYCVEDNIAQCEALGYTQTNANETCPGQNQRISCPFDPTYFRCVSWTCDEMGLLTAKPDNMNCTEVPNQVAGITCLKCQCADNFINFADCDGLVASLAGEDVKENKAEEECRDLGYSDIPSQCTNGNYIVCPMNPYKVHCLGPIKICDENEENCRFCREDSCVDAKIPHHAIPLMSEEAQSCSCGQPRKVIVGWAGVDDDDGNEIGKLCEDGFVAEGDSCVMTECPEDEFEGPAQSDASAPKYKISQCYDSDQSTSPYWQKEYDADHSTPVKHCYKCVCKTINSSGKDECPYVIDRDESDPSQSNKLLKQTYGYLSEKCCDGSYKKCERRCPTDVYVPLGAEPHYEDCDGCQEAETKQFIDSWECKPGYNETYNGAGEKIGCEVALCPKNDDFNYYSTLYTKLSDCTAKLGNGYGWRFDQEAYDEGTYKSGDEICGHCECTVNPNEYRYTNADAYNAGYAVLSELGCNGKYRECRETRAVTDNYYIFHNPGQSYPTHIASKETVYVCQKEYFRIARCETNYQLTDDKTECLPQDCNGFTLTSCPDHGYCGQSCRSGETELFKLRRCDPDVTTHEEYKIDSSGTQCCKTNCPSGFMRLDECPTTRTLIAEDVNGCGERCVQCE